ncbi:MAG: ATP-grasp domain-containing protein [Candidatus Auribacterota bacterium]|nr:ATP-grasp domain-containing protein [Candidatus Auribacterota bacterium]
MIGAGVEQVPGIKLARKMGLYVITTDRQPKAPGFRYANESVVISTYDVESTVRFAVKYNRKRKIDGVMTVASDVPLTVASVANALCLPGNSIRTAKLASNKLLMKRRFVKDGVPIPEFSGVKNVKEVKKFIKKHRYPVVLKPVDSRGARGVLRLTRGVDLEWAFKKSKSESPVKQVMIEKFLNGLQISSESIIYDDCFITPGLSNRNYEYLEKFSPHVIENGGDLPVSLNKQQKVKVDELLIKAAKSLGIKRGSLKGDIVYTKDGPKVIEIAARLSGGWFATDEIPFSTGVNIVKAVINISLGIKPDFKKLVPRYQKYVAQRYLFSDEGRITKISGLAKARKLPNVRKIGINIEPGRIVGEINNHTKRTGFVITVADTRKKSIAAAKKAVSLIKAEVD